MNRLYTILSFTFSNAKADSHSLHSNCFKGRLMPGINLCATKVNNESFSMSYKYDDEALGFCPENCKGEIVRQESKYNVALVRIKTLL